MAKLTPQDMAISIAYRKCQAKQFGDLHQRMKYVVELMQQAREVIPNDLWHAIYDLETEAMHYPPQRPPYWRRTMSLNEV